jgi:hypothetical protein
MLTMNDLLDAASRVTAKRAKIVINHIIKHGFITTEELKDLYNYSHPPRAARDVREQGIPLDTYTVTDKGGRKIGAYKFGDPNEIEAHKLGGRKVFSKLFKETLINRNGAKCAISNEQYDARYLQIDHRLPYEVAGDTIGSERQPEMFMLLTGTAQRQKSWSCEHCDNFITQKSIEICQQCYWAYPENYTHVAMREERRVDIVFSGEETSSFDLLKDQSDAANLSIQTLIKTIINENI